MHLTDRLLNYFDLKGITIHNFEKVCGLGNGYFGKQYRGKGSVGSDILEKIADQYPDLNLNWLITGRGMMLQKPPKGMKSPENIIVMEEDAVYAIRNKLVTVLKDQLKTLEETLPRARRKKDKLRKLIGN